MDEFTAPVPNKGAPRHIFFVQQRHALAYDGFFFLSSRIHLGADTARVTAVSGAGPGGGLAIDPLLRLDRPTPTAGTWGRLLAWRRERAETRALRRYQKSLGLNLGFLQCRALVRCGWSVPAYQGTVNVLAAWAVEHETALRPDSLHWRPVGAAEPYGAARQWLAGLLDEAYGRPIEITLGWLTVLIGAPSAEEAEDLGQDLHFGDGRVSAYLPLGSLGPWAYAAGLTPDEAWRQQEMGTLTGEGVQALATLRGYRLLSPASVMATWDSR